MHPFGDPNLVPGTFVPKAFAANQPQPVTWSNSDANTTDAAVKRAEREAMDELAATITRLDSADLDPLDRFAMVAYAASQCKVHRVAYQLPSVVDAPWPFRSQGVKVSMRELAPWYIRHMQAAGKEPWDVLYYDMKPKLFGGGLSTTRRKRSSLGWAVDGSSDLRTEALNGFLVDGGLVIAGFMGPRMMYGHLREPDMPMYGIAGMAMIATKLGLKPPNV